MKAKQPTKPRTLLDIETDFIPAIATLRGVNDLLIEATKYKDDTLEDLEEGTLHALAQQCYRDANTVKDLFYELLNMRVEVKS